MKSFSSGKIRFTHRAFTLLELMVSVALLAVIIIGLLAMFTQVQRAWKSGITQVDVMEGGRAAIALVARDLQEMTANPSTNASHALPSLPPNSPTQVVSLNFRAAIPQNSPDILLKQVDDTVRVNVRQVVSFLTRVGDQWTGTAYIVSNDVAGVGTLYRLTASAPMDQSVQAVLGAYQSYPTNVNYLSDYVMAPSFNLPPIPASWPGTLPPYRTNGFARVLDGVVHFTVDAFDTNGTRMLRSEVDGDFYCANFYNANGLNIQMPSYVEVEIAVLEPAVLERFNARLDSGAPLDIFAATNYLHGKAGQVHIFRQRIPIRSAATAVDLLRPGS